MKLALIGFLALATLAVAISDPHLAPLMFGALVFGAVTTTYLYPTNNGPLAGGNVAPTGIQMGGEYAAKFNEVICTIVATSAADTSAVITHNFALTNSEISQGFPEVNILLTSNDQSQPWELSENPNYTVLGLPGLVGGVKVYVKRPSTIVR